MSINDSGRVAERPTIGHSFLLQIDGHFCSKTTMVDGSICVLSPSFIVGEFPEESDSWYEGSNSWRTAVLLRHLVRPSNDNGTVCGAVIIWCKNAEQHPSRNTLSHLDNIPYNGELLIRVPAGTYDKLGSIIAQPRFSIPTPIPQPSPL